MRRTAKLVKVDKKTIARRLLIFAKQGRLHLEDQRHEKRQALSEIQADEMESFIHTKLKPVSIPLVVCPKDRKILAFDVVTMPCKGPLAKRSLKKYGPRQDLRAEGFKGVLSQVRPLLLPESQILTDQKPMYRSWIKSVLGSEIVHKTTPGRRGCVVGQGELKEGGFDPLFALNHTAAMIRDNISRLRRRTWATSKIKERLADHIAIYALYHNTVLTPV